MYYKKTKPRLPLSLVPLKTKDLATEFQIPPNDFEASWRWLSKFRERKGLHGIMSRGEGGDVNK